MSGEGFEEVGSGREGYSGDLGDILGEYFCELGVSIEAGSDGGTALGEFVQSWRGGLESVDGVGDLLGVS